MSNLFIKSTGALLGMLAVAGGFYLSRKWLIPWLHVDLTSKPYDPVAAKAASLQNLRAGKA